MNGSGIQKTRFNNRTRDEGPTPRSFLFLLLCLPPGGDTNGCPHRCLSRKASNPAGCREARSGGRGRSRSIAVADKFVKSYS
ncbi:hypothetical protein GUJ93_ZPchr0018g11332 [Zizania palustris]|uniref:Uncharacterized protein n=1 Tax=Zizania palustris TaxID=103762 RepID=A0A8J5SW65_ZIZPA|nr:hypothetical protein GUJ93_ZPchr0018g11332 [Zizania palustris]